MNKVDYHDALNQLFSNKMKFKFIKNGTILSRLKTVRNYLNDLQERKEITEAKKKKAEVTKVSAFGLSKTHKVFANIPKFRSIIDTTNTPHCKIGQYCHYCYNKSL